MKKLLLVLMVVAMASFLLVGCLPGVTPDPDPDPDPDPTPTPVTIAVDTFVACGKDVIVTLPTAVETDYVVYVAQKVETAGVITYENKVAATPNADRTVWTAKAYTIVPLEGECKPICLVALVKHPCCPGEEVALRVVTVDCLPPELDLFVKFTDCEDVCVIPDPCVPEVPGAYMEWTSRTTGLCATVDCCKDTCSGVNGWSLVVDFTFEDNVGNTLKSTWKLEFDTGSIIGFELGSRDADGVYQSVPGTPLTADTLGWYTVYNDLTCPLATFK
jgi:hypothetical protein